MDLIFETRLKKVKLKLFGQRLGAASHCLVYFTLHRRERNS
uniref:Uncharacterized protein n=1 Tax=Anguilla anguilla TaxID=7936 RepID=A0A0E9SMM0_ANGAN